MNRVIHATAALVQGFVFIPLSTVSGALFGILVGNVWPGLEGAAVTGAWLSLLFALLLFPSAVAAPVGLVPFLRWFFRSVFLEHFCIAITVALTTYCDRSVGDETGFLTMFVAFGTFCASHIICGILFDDPVDMQEQRIGDSRGLLSFEEVKHRADLFGRIRRGPAPDQGESSWHNGWRVLSGQFKRARGGFYESPW